MASVLMVASEASPFAKTGGLADVMAGLPVALRTRGHDVAVMLPRYRSTHLYTGSFVAGTIPVRLGTAEFSIKLYQVWYKDVAWYLVDCPPLFDREALYGDIRGDYLDNHIRFAVLSKAAVEFARTMYQPSIIHCHDWQAALVPLFMRYDAPDDKRLRNIRTVFTVHNLAFQGLFSESALDDIGLDRSLFNPEGIEFYGKVNLLKGGVLYSDVITTVSKSYAREIQTLEFGCGLEGVFRQRHECLHGIVNGVDYSEWSPESDPYLPATFSADDFAGKNICRKELLRAAGFPDGEDANPVIGIVSRLATQKGFDILIEALPELLMMGFRFVILGSGSPEYEHQLVELANSYRERLAVRIGYENGLAHRITAGTDMFLMPSYYEPCGLNQLYSLRYGTVPVVRKTGGLDDTVDESVGFKFNDYNSQAILECLCQARMVFHDPTAWKTLILRGMRKDYSWNHTAVEYEAVYRSLVPS